MDLRKAKCVPCEGGVSPMKGKLLDSYMKQVSGWALRKEGKKIAKEYRFKNDKEAIAFLKNIAALSEKEGHHPAATWVYNKVAVEFWTHAIGGLSKNDFIMAAKFDEEYDKINKKNK